jgi:ABC-type nitrate/sulfonate/bicarbonate transport system permease component
MEFLKRKITKDQSRDTGMAMVLLLMLFAASRKREGYLYAAMIVHLVNMVVPKVFHPIAIFWLGLSDATGAVMSKVLLSIVFFIVVTPIAIVRRLSGKDSLKLRTFKSGTGSAMLKRDHLFTAKDLESPY